MKPTTFLTLAMVTGLCLQPLSTFAQDEYPGKQDKKDAKVAGHKGKAMAHSSQQLQQSTGQGIAPQSYKSHGKMSKSSSQGGFAPTNSSMRSSDIAIQTQGVQQSTRRESSRQQTTNFVVQGNESNHYDGRWSSASSHSDWDRGSNHRWNNHDYRWYNGGWLIIEADSNPGYATGGSTGTQVQARLAQQGYYNGPIDGDIGPGSRRAIAHYESDNGLQVTGQIDEPLLVSLRLE